jgi:hypothetical protein
LAGMCRSLSLLSRSVNILSEEDTSRSRKLPIKLHITQYHERKADRIALTSKTCSEIQPVLSG